MNDTESIEDLVKPGFEVDRKYVVRRLIGGGAMGAVYEAEHSLLRKKYAIRFLLPKFASDKPSGGFCVFGDKAAREYVVSTECRWFTVST